MRFTASRNAPRRWRNWFIEKTGGNPFFSIQFISALAEEGLLTFDHGQGAMDLGLESYSRQGLHR